MAACLGAQAPPKGGLLSEQCSFEKGLALDEPHVYQMPRSVAFEKRAVSV